MPSAYVKEPMLSEAVYTEMMILDVLWEYQNTTLNHNERSSLNMYRGYDHQNPREATKTSQSYCSRQPTWEDAGNISAAFHRQQR